MATSRMQFDLSFGSGSQPARRRSGDAPLHLLVVADLGGARTQPLAARKALAVDIDNLEQVFARIAPRLTLELDGMPVEIAFDSPEDFHPDRLFARVGVFDTLRKLRAELQDPAQFRRAAAALGLSAPPPAAAAAATPAASAQAADDIERLLGRKPAAPAAPAAAAATPTAALERWLHDLMAPHIKPDTSNEQRALVAACDESVTALMRRVLHEAPFQRLEAAWLGVDRLVRGLELDAELKLFVLDAGIDELRRDVDAHAADLGASALHGLWVAHAGAAADASRYGAIALDHAFGLDELPFLAALGAVASRAGAPLLAAGTPALAGAADLAALAEPRRWLPADDERLALWQALRTSPMARSIGLVLPRVLMRLPYGAATDRTAAFDFDEMPAPRRHESYLWGYGAHALALLAGQAFLAGGWDMNLGEHLDLDDLPSHIHTADDGERAQQPCAELLLGENAGQALLERGLMPLLSYRNRNAVRLLRWQSIAEPPLPLAGLPG